MRRDTRRWHSFLLGIRGVLAPLLGAMLIRSLENYGLDMRWLFILALTLILTGCWMQVIGIRRRERAAEVAYT